MSDSRDLWVPGVDVTPIQYLGKEWPDVLVTRWERNERSGEKRLVDSKIYPAPEQT